MRWYQRRIVRWLGVLLVVIFVANLITPLVYVSKAIDGRAIDANTREPIEGAVVVVDWMLETNHGYPKGEIAVFEVTTDATGHFSIPRWGPRIRIPFRGHIRGNQPTMRIFKPEYLPIVVNNTPQTRLFRDYADRYLEFRLVNHSYEMERYGKVDEFYAEKLATLTYSLDYISRGRGCEWRQVPKILEALHNEKVKLDRAQVLNHLMYIQHLGGQQHCGNAMVQIRGKTQ